MLVLLVVKEYFALYSSLNPACLMQLGQTIVGVAVAWIAPFALTRRNIAVYQLVAFFSTFNAILIVLRFPEHRHVQILARALPPYMHEVVTGHSKDPVAAVLKYMSFVLASLFDPSYAEALSYTVFEVFRDNNSELSRSEWLILPSLINLAL